MPAPVSLPRRVERYRIAEWLQQDELDIKPQLKGRLTHGQFFDSAQLEEARSVRVDGLSGRVTIDGALASVRPAVTGGWRLFRQRFLPAPIH